MIARRISYLACTLFLLYACSSDEYVPGADQVFTNGAVYTVNPHQPWATAVAIHNGRITYVGDDAGSEIHIGTDTEVIDLQGKMLMPGFIDSHMHPMAAGTRFLRCDLEGLAWPEAVRDELIKCARDVKPGKWLRGVDLNEELFYNGSLDNTLLQEWVPNMPVAISGSTGFEFWVSSSVLDMVEIDRDTPDPFKGEIGRNSESGELTGVLKGTAAESVYRIIPLPGIDDLRLALKKASEMANKLGITASSEASMRPELFEPFTLAESAGEMTLRVKASQSWSIDKGFEQLEEMIRRRDQAAGGLFTAGAVKFFLDGSNNQTGALLQPYEGSKDDFGSLNFQQETLAEAIRRIDAAGMQVHMHSYYDAAVRQGLDAIEAAIATNDHWDRRHFLAHLALIDPSDLKRFKELGVVANISPLWAYLSEDRGEELAGLGEERSKRLLAFNSLFDSGALVTAGSDWISESMNPLYNIQVAMTRRSPDGSGEAWNPDERVSLERMIEAYTINGAWLMGLDNDIGSIETGKFADLVVLNQNLFDVDPGRLINVEVELTLLEGEIVSQSASYLPQ